MIPNSGFECQYIFLKLFFERGGTGILAAGPAGLLSAGTHRPGGTPGRPQAGTSDGFALRRSEKPVLRYTNRGLLFALMKLFP